MRSNGGEFSLIDIYNHCTDPERIQDSVASPIHARLKDDLEKIFKLNETVFSQKYKDSPLRKKEMETAVSSQIAQIDKTFEYIEKKGSEARKNSGDKKVLDLYAGVFMASKYRLEIEGKEHRKMEMDIFDQFGKSCDFSIVTYFSQGRNPLVGTSGGLCRGILMGAIEKSPSYTQVSEIAVDEKDAYIQWIRRVQEISHEQNNRKFIEKSFTVQRLGFSHYFTQADYLINEFIKYAKSNEGFFVVAAMGGSFPGQHDLGLRINSNHSFEFIDANSFHIKSGESLDLDAVCVKIRNFFKHEYLGNTRFVDFLHKPGPEDTYDTILFEVVKPKTERANRTLLGKVRGIVNGSKYAPGFDLSSIWIEIRRAVTAVQRFFSVAKPVAPNIATMTDTTPLLQSRQGMQILPDGQLQPDLGASMVKDTVGTSKHSVALFKPEHKKVYPAEVYTSGCSLFSRPGSADYNKSLIERLSLGLGP